MTFDPSLHYYVNTVVERIAGKKKFLPFNACPRKFLTIGMEGIEFMQNVEDMSLNQAVSILGKSLKEIYRIYGKKYLFAQPSLSYLPDRKCLILKVGMFEKDLWKELNKKKGKNETD